MPRSDSSAPASDRLMAEVVRQLADAAPPAPSWAEVLDEELLGDPSRSQPSQSRPQAPLRLVLAAAAVVAVVVSGLLLIDYGSERDELPADVPPSTTLVAVPPVLTERSWLATAGAPSAQDCVLRAIGRLVIEEELTGLRDREGLPGYDPARAQLSAIDGLVAAWIGAAAHPELDAERLDRLEVVIAAHAVAAAGTFGADPDTTAPGFVGDVAAARRQVGEYSAVGDPVACWWDTADAADRTDAAVAAVGAETTVTCLAGYGLDVLLGSVASDPDPDDVSLVAFVFGSVGTWLSTDPPPELVELNRSLERLRTDPDADPADVAVDARAQLGDVLATQSCPDGIAAPAPDDLSPPTDPEES